MADVVCLGGTGTVGRLVVAGLRARGATVRCGTRSPDATSAPDEGVTLVTADFERPDTLVDAMRGAGRLHLLTPLHPEEARLGAATVDAAETAGIERIVFHSVHRAEHAPRVPHFRSKMEILAAIEASGIPWATIEPNNYFQNDLWLQEAMTGMGVYPTPLGSVGLHRVDTRDIADATVNALLDEGHEGMRHPIIGPECLTGEACAAAWSEALGRPIAYVGDDLDAWDEGARTMMPDWMVEDLRLMWEHFGAQGLVATEEDFATMSHVLGHAPRTFGDFVSETAAAWQS
ncbi:MAG: NmrA family NAD(P)-binding protein [Gemmatimonadetes bacterium]|nr:NmrA family NAD(P)-binding protein [Gemmatimonadota bacterium]